MSAEIIILPVIPRTVPETPMVRFQINVLMESASADNLRNRAAMQGLTVEEFITEALMPTLDRITA